MTRGDTPRDGPEVERIGPALTFRLWTHVRGAVTEADLELADRITLLVRRHGG